MTVLDVVLTSRVAVISDKIRERLNQLTIIPEAKRN
jgi:hypothetical protein